MVPPFEDLCATLSLTEIIRLRDMLSKALTQRFERPQALAFSDMVGSTPYFARFGDEAGRTLQQRHIDLLRQAIAPRDGRVVDTAGDGAFLCFPSADSAADALVELMRSLFTDNASRPKDHQLALRIGLHWGPVLTDGTLVTGDAVNFCARVAGSAEPGQIRATKEAFLAFGQLSHRLQCTMLEAVHLKGVTKPAELMVLHWRDRSVFPHSVRLPSGQDLPLPDKDVISFGRLREHNGVPANDVILSCADPISTQQISRWHFELIRQLDGYVLRPTSSGATVVDGKPVQKGEEVPVRPGTVVGISEVLTLTFLGEGVEEQDTNATLLGPRSQVAPGH